MSQKNSRPAQALRLGGGNFQSLTIHEICTFNFSQLREGRAGLGIRGCALGAPKPAKLVSILVEAFLLEQ